MKKILYILFSILILSSCEFSSLKSDRIVKKTNDSIYVMHYSFWTGDSCILNYHQPIQYICKICNKRHKHRKLYIWSNKGNLIRLNYYSNQNKYYIYDNTKIGDLVIVDEHFYPIHEIYYNSKYKK